MSKVSISLLHVACKVSLMTDISPNWSHEQYKLHIIFFHHEDENMNSEYLQHSRRSQRGGDQVWSNDLILKFLFLQDTRAHCQWYISAEYS